MTDGLTFKEIKGVKFYPRTSATEYGREVYLANGGGRIEIMYSAVLNENAVLNGEHKLICTDTDHSHTDACCTDSNDNESYVKYGHIAGVESGEEPQPEDPDDPVPTPSGKTPKDETKTYTYKFVDGDSATKLAGAEFELRKSFVGIGTAAVEGKGNAYVSDGKLDGPCRRVHDQRCSHRAGGHHR